MQVVAGATSEFWVTSCARISLFVASAARLLLLLCCMFFRLPWYRFSWCFFRLVSCLLFLLWKSVGYTIFCLLVFVCFGAVVCFFAFYIRIHIYIIPLARWSAIIPSLNPLWPPRLSLPTTWCFVARHHTCKICPDSRFLTRFPLFSCPPVRIHPIASLQTHLHPSGAIFAHFAFVLQNMMFGEFSPAIGPKSGPARP